ncbi:MAG: hypothetical protein J5545_09535 [Bacteroidaceae bacterium]|nr:hypothetical protein [Bacteroidaceae bacterium]
MRKTIYVLSALCLSLLGQAEALAQTKSETLRVWMDDITLTADGETITKLTVYENDVKDYASFNMSFVVPDGIRIAQVSAGRGKVKNDVELSDRGTESHTITANQPSETLIKVSCISMEGENLYPDDVDGNPLDELFTIGLVADPTALNGAYTITLGDLDFGLIIDEQGNMEDITMEELPTFQLTITGGQDGLTIPYTLTASGVGTLVLPFDAEVPEGLMVLTATDVVGNEVQLSQQTRIVAGTPLIVMGEAGAYTFQGVPATTETTFTEGVLTGTTVQQSITAGYVLQTQNGETGFFRISADDPITIPAYRCWLNYDSEVKWLGLPEGLLTAIRNGKWSQENGQWFDLGGRPTSVKARGMKVQQGRKTIHN